MSPTVVGQKIVWDGPAHGEVFSLPIDVQAWTGERVDVVVDRDAVAIVVRDHEVSGVLLSAQHAVHVLRHGEEPGDVSAREFAGRMRCDVEDVERLKPRCCHLPSDARLTFVAVGALVFVEFGRANPVLFRDHRRGDVEVEIEGVARLAVVDPVAFHASFLASTEDLRRADFERIVAALVEAGIGKALETATDDVEAIEPDPRTLASGAADALRSDLAGLGLDVEDLEITRLETPTGTAVVRAAEPTSLATRGDRS